MILRLLFKLTYKPVSDYMEKAYAERLFKELKKDEFIKNQLIQFLNQCAEESKQKYFQKPDAIYKGMALAYTSMRVKLEQKDAKTKKSNKQVNY